MNNYNGWLVLDKPAGITSADVLNRIKKALKPKKIGHAGTLDAFATGVLLVAFGEATKTADYAMHADKEYVFSIKWGEETDTLDPNGSVVNSGGFIPNEQQVRQALQKFVGEIEQVPPKYSAVKIRGKRASDWERQGSSVELAARKVKIYEIELLSHKDDISEVRVVVSKGFYVRSLARDIAHSLATYGFVSTLNRIRSGCFSIDMALKESDLSVNDLQKSLIPLQNIFRGKIIELSPEEADHLKCGRKIVRSGLGDGEVYLAMFGQYPIAICLHQDGEVSSIRGFNLS